MPYSSNADLPKRIREAMPDKAQSIFRNVFNSVIDEEGATEASAFAQAYGALENAGYHQDTEGDWVKKSDDTWSLNFDIKKIEDDQQLVFGWLSIAYDAKGNQVEDADHDIIEEVDLEQAAYNHVLKFRKAGENHQEIIGDLVESMIFTKEKQQALGIPDGILPIGWWVGYRLEKKEAWDKVKSGQYDSFSVGGRGRREIVE